MGKAKPYNLKSPRKGLKERIKKYFKNQDSKARPKDIRQFIHVFNNSLKKGDPESTAYAKAWGVINNRFEDKKDSKKEKKSSMEQRLTKLAEMLKDLECAEASKAVEKLTKSAQVSGYDYQEIPATLVDSGQFAVPPGWRKLREKMVPRQGMVYVYSVPVAPSAPEAAPKQAPKEEAGAFQQLSDLGQALYEHTLPYAAQEVEKVFDR